MSSPCAAAAKSLQSCPTLCDSIDGRPTGSPVPGILQARTLEWVAISFSSLVAQLCPTPCDPMECSPPGSYVYGDSPSKNTEVGCQALLQGIFPTQGSKPRSPALQVDSLPSEPPGSPSHISRANSVPGLFINFLNSDNYEADSFSPWRRGGPGNPPQRSCLEKAHHRPSLLFSPSVLSLCDPMDCSIPAVPVLHHLLEFAQNHVH